MVSIRVEVERDTYELVRLCFTIMSEIRCRAECMVPVAKDGLHDEHGIIVG